MLCGKKKLVKRSGVLEFQFCECDTHVGERTREQESSVAQLFLLFSVNHYAVVMERVPIVQLFFGFFIFWRCV